MIKAELYCLKCKNELFFNNGVLICSKCKTEYEYNDGIIFYEKDLPKFIEEYWEEFEGTNNLIEPHLREFLDFRIYERILDLGCGNGRCTSAISDFGTSIYCLDSSINMLKKLQRREIKNANLILGNAKELPFPNSFFDLVVSVSLVEHIPYNILPKVFSEVNRVLKKDGIFLVRNDT